MRDKMATMVAKDCIAVLKGEKPSHLVNPEVLGQFKGERNVIV